MLMTERFELSCVEEKFLLRADERARFLKSLGSERSIRRDDWQITTLYLDREDGMLARNALARPDSHAEVRIRELFTPGGGTVSSSVWVESKEQDGRACSINRFQLDRCLVGPFLIGDLDEGMLLACQDRFIEPDRVLKASRAVRRAAGPGSLTIAGAVSYLRTTFEGGSARVTIDQGISYHLAPSCVDGPRTSFRRNSLGPAALEEADAVVELKYRRARPPEWCVRRLAVAEPLDYSKFRVVSALALSDRVRCRAVVAV